jgi:hypothetical protein
LDCRQALQHVPRRGLMAAWCWTVCGLLPAYLPAIRYLVWTSRRGPQRRRWLEAPIRVAILAEGTQRACGLDVTAGVSMLCRSVGAGVCQGGPGTGIVGPAVRRRPPPCCCRGCCRDCCRVPTPALCMAICLSACLLVRLHQRRRRVQRAPHRLRLSDGPWTEVAGSCSTSGL